MKAIAASDVILAGGLLPGIKESYFRVGHMGSVTGGDILATVAAVTVPWLHAATKNSLNLLLSYNN
jgi:aspartate aminotransferase-like enzyme